MNWIKASDRLGDFKDSDIPHWKFFNCDFAKVDGKPVERPFFRKDIESGKIVFSYKGVFGSNELPESEFHRIVWLDEQDEGWVPVVDGKFPRDTPLIIEHEYGYDAFRLDSGQWVYWYSGHPVPPFLIDKVIKTAKRYLIANNRPSQPPATKD